MLGTMLITVGLSVAVEPLGRKPELALAALHLASLCPADPITGSVPNWKAGVELVGMRFRWKEVRVLVEFVRAQAWRAAAGRHTENALFNLLYVQNDLLYAFSVFGKRGPNTVALYRAHTTFLNTLEREIRDGIRAGQLKATTFEQAEALFSIFRNAYKRLFRQTA
jgi:hypothetical protein